MLTPFIENSMATVCSFHEAAYPLNVYGSPACTQKPSGVPHMPTLGFSLAYTPAIAASVQASPRAQNGPGDWLPAERTSQEPSGSFSTTPFCK